MLIRLSRRRTNSERNTVHGRDSKRRFHVGFPVSKVRYYRLPCMGRMDCHLSAFASGRNVALLVISISFRRRSTDGMVKHKIQSISFSKIQSIIFQQSVYWREFILVENNDRAFFSTSICEKKKLRNELLTKSQPPFHNIVI